jgi:hypothetical protein
MPGYGKRPRNSVFIYISLYQLHTANRGRWYSLGPDLSIRGGTRYFYPPK